MMMKNIIIIFTLIFAFISLDSCRSEYIELRSKNYMKIYDNDLMVKIVPKKNKIVVKAFYYDPIIGESQDPKKFLIKSNERIKKRLVHPKESYYKMIESFEKIDESLMKSPEPKIDSAGNLHYIMRISCGASSISVMHKKRRVKKTIHGDDMLEEYGYFYITSKMILEEAGLELKDLNR